MTTEKEDNLDKEKLLAEIERLKKKFKKRKKYGLVWEDKLEEVVEMCKEKLPILKEVKSKEIITDPDKPVNLLIEGDNYHALSVLSYTHEKKIDFIYIDPPYNTGARDWKYNNNYVDGEDPYRHTKWLSFMSHRLKIAKDLLKDDGVICCTIDDYEMPRLWLLMDDIFNADNHLGTIIIRNNPKGRKTERKASLIHEYAIFYGRSVKAKLHKLPVAIEEKTHSYKQDKDGRWYLPVNLRKQGVDSLALLPSGKLSDRHYPIYYDPKTERVSSIKKYEVEILPIDAKGQKRIWRRGKEDIDKMYQDSDLWYKRTKQGDQIYFKFRGGLDGEPPESIWFDSRFSASEHGTQMLDNILSKREMFPFPKSPYAVAECIKIASPNQNAVILDFFAGSGTTAQAVLELNASDNGYRTFILCTNNENNICDEVCYPRVGNVIRGYKFQGKYKHILYENKLTFSKLKNMEGINEDIEQIIEENQKEFDELDSRIEDNTIKIIGIKNITDKKDGLGGNLKYFKTDFVGAEATDRDKKKLTEQATEMLCIREWTFEPVLDQKKLKVFKNNSHYAGIIFDQLAIPEFKNAIKDIKGKFSVYVFSLGDDTFDEEFEDIKQKVKLSPIPEAILRVYRRIFK